MEIRMRTLSAGPRGVRQAGKKYEVETAEANELIAGGFAVPADGSVAKGARGAKVERATAPAAPETATGEAQTGEPVTGDASTGEPAVKGAPKSRAKKPVK